ncbi:MAG: hypothetical protein HQL52_01840 [Magnetococcales bacterium]|nr:hypothetical protein [Magnetococcales bacterium]
MIMVIVIMSILASVGSTMISNTMKSYFMSRDIVPLSNQGHVIMERMVRELQEGQCATVSNPGGGTDDLQFDDADSPANTIQFSQTDTEIFMDSDILGQNIQAGSLTFNIDTSKCYVQLRFVLEYTLSDFAGGGTIEIPFQTGVHMRN